MTDTAETLVTILEVLTKSQHQLVETLTRMEERQEERSRALTAFLAESLQRLSKQIADNDRAMAEILERVVHTTDRTEQLTARILAEIGGDLGH